MEDGSFAWSSHPTILFCISARDTRSQQVTGMSGYLGVLVSRTPKWKRVCITVPSQATVGGDIRRYKNCPVWFRLLVELSTSSARRLASLFRLLASATEGAGILPTGSHTIFDVTEL